MKFEKYELKFIDDIKFYTYEKELIQLIKNNEFNKRFLGDNYLKKITGRNLNIPVFYISRNHGWSTNKFK